jgi:hypothetical protein
VSPTNSQRAAERGLHAQAELAYRRLVDDWHNGSTEGWCGCDTGARI